MKFQVGDIVAHRNPDCIAGDPQGERSIGIVVEISAITGDIKVYWPRWNGSAYFYDPCEIRLLK
jgi:hypothetical protein